MQSPRMIGSGIRGSTGSSTSSEFSSNGCIFVYGFDIFSVHYWSSMLERDKYCTDIHGGTGGFKMKPTRTTLTPEEMPKKWYNILPDLPVPLPPPLNPGTKQPISPS